MKNRTRYLLLAAALLLVVCLSPMKRDIQKVYPCYAVHMDDPSYCEEVTVTINGVYSDYLFRKDRFEGYIDVSPFRYFPEEAPFIPTGYQAVEPVSVQISTDYTDAIHFCYACYGPLDPSLPELDLCDRGSLIAAEDLEQFILSLYDYTAEDAPPYVASIYLSYPDKLTADEARSRIYPAP